MPRNSSGVYSPPPETTAVTNTTIESTPYNNLVNDLATALTGSLPRDGSAGMLADLAMGSNNITGLANGTSSGDAANKGQLDAINSSLAASIAAVLNLASGGTIGGNLVVSGTLAATGNVSFSSTGFLLVPVGTTAQAPSPTLGNLRWNSTLNKFTVADGSNFLDIVTGDPATTGEITAETVGDKFIRADRLSSSQRVAKAWAYITNNGTAALVDSFNVASINRNSTGDVSVTFSTAIGNANYAAIATLDSVNVRIISIKARTTASVRVLIQNTGGNPQDDDFSVIVFGD